MVLCTCRSILGRKGRGRQILAIILGPGFTESIMTHYSLDIISTCHCYQSGDGGAAGPELGARQCLLR